ncbi:MAG: adenylate kinase family protein [Candidatus Thermoplasmatota archaeon]|nr:adenylate kinase family protein [Candidatus Thermoplasmatota archaeon]
MKIALTGTPGTGKTSVSQILIKNGIKVIDLNDLAISKNFTSGQDSKRKSAIIDTIKLNDYIKKNFNTNDTIIFESHLSHLLKCMDKIIILRCHPKELQKRLKTKKWNKKKIQENVEAEILDIVLSESVEIQGTQKLLEIDTTQKSPEELSEKILELIDKKFNGVKNYKIGCIDWSEEILKYY